MSTQQPLPLQNPVPVSGIRDNRARGTLAGFLRGVVEPGAELSIVSAYFTIYAHAALRDVLDSVERVRFLFGEPRFLRAVDPGRTDSRVYEIADDGLALANRLEQKPVARACSRWIEERVEVRSVRHTGLLHGKLYHTAKDGRESAIVGSSNLTTRGLGVGAGPNIELNLVVDSSRDRLDLKTWFDELWSDEAITEDVKTSVLSYLAQLYENRSPEFIYYKTLFHLFERMLADEQRAELLQGPNQLIDSQIWNTLFSFQRDGVKGAINKILRYRGCIIADSVGLGKTYEALAVIKYFELRNERVLVLCPRKLRDNWTIYQAQVNSQLNPLLADRFGYTVLSHTDLGRAGGKSGDVDLATFNWANYDLVVIDESHNFRNNARGRRDEHGNLVARSRYDYLMEDVLRAGAHTKVLLLSATPVNNDLRDLRNQIYLLSEGRDDAYAEDLKISSLRETLTAAQRVFNSWAQEPPGKRTTRELLTNLGPGLFTLLDQLTIARSRRHIEKYYADSMAELGPFPDRLKPDSIYPDIDTDGSFPGYDKLNDEISNYRLSLFSPSLYVRPEHRAKYENRGVRNFTQTTREHFLIGMMKVNFLKRLESSIQSFEQSMQRTVEKIRALEQKIQLYQQSRDEDIAFDWNAAEAAESDDDELDEELLVGGRLKFDLRDLDVDRWLGDLQADRQQLHSLWLSAKDVTVERDAKLRGLRRIIAQKIANPTVMTTGEPNRKVLVFTAFSDTACYLYDALERWAREELGVHIALVTGAAGNKTTLGSSDFAAILMNFSPRAKRRARLASMPQDEEIAVLIATDCISEGQNLQDCDWVVNYDIHWNPVRVIQRFGRIDRIGSVNSEIRMINFWPTEDLNKYINLKNRVEARMALVNIAATGLDDPLNAEELEELIKDDLHYRDQQLLRLRSEVLDLEDLSDSVTLTDFTLDDFRADLVRYLEANRRALEEAPLGLTAVVPPHSDYPLVQPGVIFCLQQRGPGAETVNPLQPYFLVYVHNDGEVRFTFTHPKQILEILRVTCAGRSAPYDSLCELFERLTEPPAGLSAYSALLDRAVGSIVRTFRKRAATQLTTDRAAVLPKKQEQVSAAADFALVTWLVILEDAA